jgi:hypothetical protein
MMSSYRSAALCLLSLFCALAVGGRALSQGGPDEAGVEILARGPVHEAFAEPVVFDPQPGIVVPKRPPEPIDELPPEQRPAGENVAWIPGYWAWDEVHEDFIWISGFWRALPPNREWTPGYWTPVTDGWQWVAGYWADAEAESTDYLPEPPDSLEVGPSTEAPSENHAWIPGHWHWHQARYVWRPGYWYVSQPDWVWCPAHYLWTPRGYVFVNGYWDHVVARRGLLFSPVRFERPIYRRVGYFYSPSVVVNVNALVNHFFVRPHYHHYYFGDFYASSWLDAGVYPWFAFHRSRRGHDAILVHHHHHHHRDRDWDRRVREEYWHRREHREARPPRTFAAVQSQRDGDRGERLVRTLAQVAAATDTPIRLERIDRDRRNQVVERSRETRRFVQERARVETDDRTGPAKIDRPDRDKVREKDKGTVDEPDKAPRIKRPKSPISGKLPDTKEPAPKRPEQPKFDPDAQPTSRPRDKDRPKFDPRKELDDPRIPGKRDDTDPRGKDRPKFDPRKELDDPRIPGKKRDDTDPRGKDRPKFDPRKELDDPRIPGKKRDDIDPRGKDRPKFDPRKGIDPGKLPEQPKLTPKKRDDVPPPRLKDIPKAPKEPRGKQPPVGPSKPEVKPPPKESPKDPGLKEPRPKDKPKSKKDKD